MSGANYGDIAQLPVDEHKPAQDKRAQKDLTQTRISCHKSAKLCGPKLQDFTGLYDSGLHYGSLSRDHARLAREHSPAQRKEQPFPRGYLVDTSPGGV